MKFLLPTLLFVLSLFVSFGQQIDYSMDDFSLTGDAVKTGGYCLQLTEATTWQGGAAWYKTPVNLKNPFQMEIDVSFGCKDYNGADGMVFIFHPELTTGYAGEGMGFGRLAPSFGIEMDTYENYHLDDPPYDHVAFMQHGRMHHYYGITDPVPLAKSGANIEDCGSHRVKINWDSGKQLIQFYFDGDMRLQKQINLVDQIFGGDPVVYWGLSSATGSMVNRHLVCLESLAFTEVHEMSKSNQLKLLRGGSYTLQGMNFSLGSTVIPNGATNELDNLVDFLKQNPEHSIYIDGYTDSSGNAERNKQLSERRAH